MRMWALLGLAVLVFGAVNVGSSMALSDIAGRPILALVSPDGETRVPVQQPWQPAAPGEARSLGGQGVMFGYRNSYLLPDGGQVDCTIRFRALRCSGGWKAERAS